MFGFGAEIGIDLGTASVLVYIKGKGIVLQEPSVVAIDKNTNQLLAVGVEARKMLGRTPGNIVAIRPLKDGVISDYEVTERMLRYFISKTCGRRRFFKPKIIVCVPSGVTEVEKRAVIDATTEAGGGTTYLIEEPIAAAIGAGIDISKPDGNMIVDIGGGTADIAVISLGGIVVSESIKVAGDKFDEAIVRYMRKRHNLLIGERTAEDLKVNIGTAYPRSQNQKMDCRGRDLVSGLPKTISVTSEEMQEALEEPVTAIADAVHSVLEKTPPELAADISDRGIVMTGGGALLHGLNMLIEKRTGIPTYIAEDAVSCVAKGTGMSLESLQILEKSMTSSKTFSRLR
ncbi:rod shape-determining protein [Anaerosolibacter sp.]|jgi:rod shape-determining protein MreB|uniref:rod shape-determining protein n=1 Tax=Anaerosolibacter sp. TaxID=1872527 RepID=UPI002636C205|nr:rod shape-determining protein [Anaerosolibacter sp.]MDF2545673.1 rod shape-determining protein [Anaerosolibacter sp.]